MFSLGEMQSMSSSFFSAYASIAASLMLFRTIAYDVIPEPLKSALFSALTNFFKPFFARFFSPLPNNITIIVDEHSGITRNQIYDAAEIYLRTKINPDTERFKVNKNPKQKNINISMDKNQQVVDFFKDFNLKWQFVLIEPENHKDNFMPEKRYFELTFDRHRRDDVINHYLPFILAKAKEIKENERAVKLYTRDFPYDDEDGEGGHGGGYWGCVNLDHPSTFDTLAMDPRLKQSILEDLDMFVRRREYYKRVGKAWKRGYLLYGPPGTGKSSLIAAIANYLKFDVYDLELTSLYSNSELRRYLLSTTNRSIIVVEDIDCSAQMHDREAELENGDSKLTLSGMLNFIDGLWSTCGDERILIFTTNHKEKLDPALVRPGRMDMHIHMGYCTPEGFDVLAFNYLGIKDHTSLFPEIKKLIQEVEISPAEIAEHLMRNENADLALEGVIDLLKEKEKKRVNQDEQSVMPESGVAKEMKSDEIEAEAEEKENKRKHGKIGKHLQKFIRFQLSRGSKRKIKCDPEQKT